MNPHLFTLPMDNSGNCGECGRSCLDDIHTAVPFIQSGQHVSQDTIPAALNRSHVKGWNEAIEIAAQHVEAQHAVWDMTDVPPRVLLDMLAKNIRAFKQ